MNQLKKSLLFRFFIDQKKASDKASDKFSNQNLEKVNREAGIAVKRAAKDLLLITIGKIGRAHV